MENAITIERSEWGKMIYVCGTEHRYSVGDHLYEYEFYSDYEGEIDLGVVVKVEYSEEYDDWLYTMDNGDEYGEAELYSEQAYKK